MEGERERGSEGVRERGTGGERGEGREAREVRERAQLVLRELQLLQKGLVAQLGDRCQPD